MKLSIVICTWNRNENLQECVQSLVQQTYKNFEVIIVSPNVELQIPAELQTKIIRDPQRGLAAARDVGWRAAKGDLIAWIDDDVIVDRNWAKEAVSAFENDSVGGISGPTIVPKHLLKNRLVFWWYGSNSWLAKLWTIIMLDNNPYQIGKITRIGWWTPGSNFEACLSLKCSTEVDYLEACNMILRRSLVEKVGGFDLHFKGTSEWCEVDLAMRVKKLGYKLLFNPHVKVEHNVSTTGVFTHRNNLIERLANYVYFRQNHL